MIASKNMTITGWLVTIILGIMLFNLGMTFQNGVTSSKNSSEVKTIKNEVFLIREDYITKPDFNKIVRTYEMQYQILLKLDREQIQTAQQMQVLFEDFRKEIIFGIDIPVRGTKKK